GYRRVVKWRGYARQFHLRFLSGSNHRPVPARLFPLHPVRNPEPAFRLLQIWYLQSAFDNRLDDPDQNGSHHVPEYTVDASAKRARYSTASDWWRYYRRRSGDTNSPDVP